MHSVFKPKKLVRRRNSLDISHLLFSSSSVLAQPPNPFPLPPPNMLTPPPPPMSHHPSRPSLPPFAGPPPTGANGPPPPPWAVSFDRFA